MSDITYPWALVAGFLSFLSPCVLPLVPPYLSYLAGASVEELAGAAVARARLRLIGVALLFVLGFSTVFVSMGAGASLLGQLLRQYESELRIIAGVAIIVMGLHFLGVFRIALLYRQARFQGPAGGSFAGAYGMGLAFAFGWTPCISPALGAILGRAGSTQTLGEGVTLLAVYSIGLGLPFIVAAVGIAQFMRLMQRMKPHLGKIEKAMGVLLIVTGAAFIANLMQDANSWLLETFPALGQLG